MVKPWSIACDWVKWSPVFVKVKSGTAELCIAERPIPLSKGQPTILLLPIHKKWSTQGYQAFLAERLGSRVIQHRMMASNISSTKLEPRSPSSLLPNGTEVKSIEVQQQIKASLQGETSLWAENHAPFMIPKVPHQVRRHPRDLEGVLKKDGETWSVLEKEDLLEVLGLSRNEEVEWKNLSRTIGVQPLTELLIWAEKALNEPKPGV